MEQARSRSAAQQPARRRRILTICFPAAQPPSLLLPSHQPPSACRCRRTRGWARQLQGLHPAGRPCCTQQAARRRLLQLAAGRSPPLRSLGRCLPACLQGSSNQCQHCCRRSRPARRRRCRQRQTRGYSGRQQPDSAGLAPATEVLGRQGAPAWPTRPTAGQLPRQLQPWRPHHRRQCRQAGSRAAPPPRAAWSASCRMLWLPFLQKRLASRAGRPPSSCRPRRPSRAAAGPAVVSASLRCRPWPSGSSGGGRRGRGQGLLRRL